MSLKTRKVAIIGTGHVGSHCAWALAMQGVCDELVMIDIDQPKALAQATDISDSIAYLPHHMTVYPGSIADCKDADLVVISAGPLPDPKGSRTDMLGETVEIMNQIIPPLTASGFEGILVNISNPCDVITRYLCEKTGFPAKRVLGTGTALDSARLRRVLSQTLDLDPKSIHAYVLGEHGESQMVPWSNAAIGGKSLLELMGENPTTYGMLDLSKIAETARRAGWVVLEGKGSTEFGIASALVEIVKAIFHNEHKLLPVSTLLEGQYGQRDVFAGVPAVLGRNGVLGVLELPLSDGERAEFLASCEAMRSFYTKI